MSPSERPYPPKTVQDKVELAGELLRDADSQVDPVIKYERLAGSVGWLIGAVRDSTHGH